MLSQHLSIKGSKAGFHTLTTSCSGIHNVDLYTSSMALAHATSNIAASGHHHHFHLRCSGKRQHTVRSEPSAALECYNCQMFTVCHSLQGLVGELSTAAKTDVCQAPAGACEQLHAPVCYTRTACQVYVLQDWHGFAEHSSKAVIGQLQGTNEDDATFV